MGDEFGDFFDDWMKRIGPGPDDGNGGDTFIMPEIFGKLRYRQGGSKTSWENPGAAKYTPGPWQFQAGSVRWTGGARKVGTEDVSMPVEFGFGFLVIASPTATTPNFEDVTVMCSISNNQDFTLIWHSVNNLTRVVINWIAMGTISL